MLRAGLFPAVAAGLACVLFAWVKAGPDAAAAAVLGAAIVAMAMATGPMIFTATRGSSPGVTFVVGVFAYFGLVAFLGVLLVVLLEAEDLAGGYLALTLIVGTVAGLAGMLVWTWRARMPVYEAPERAPDPPA
jgi:hypothetical protein